jgi:hypothetical protein
LRPLLADSVEKGGCCDAEISVNQSVSLAGLQIMMETPNLIAPSVLNSQSNKDLKSRRDHSGRWSKP